MSLALQTNDILELGALPAAVRAEVDAWRRQLARVAPPIQKSLEGVAAALGVSLQTARRKYDAWRKANYDWRALVNRAKAPDFRDEGEAALKQEFQDWFIALAEKNQRATRPAWRKFCEVWKSGAAIPGLDNELPRHELPKGCSYANLQRLCKDKFALARTRVGAAAAAKHAPQILTTRAGLWVGSHIMFDDVWHDHFVVFQGKVVRVLELGALDVFSGCRFAWGMKPRVPREDGVMDSLKEKYMRFLLADTLHNHGYSARGTELLAEHGTAAIRERMEQLLYDRTGGLIKTRRSGMIGQEMAIAGAWRGGGGGNPRFKAALESWHNLLHNEMASLPGQTGKDVEHRPEFLDGAKGLLSHQTDLLKAMAILARERPERAALLKHKLLDYFSQFQPLAIEMYQRINGRTWHDLEGWHACGHIQIDYRLAPSVETWLAPADFAVLPATTQQMVVACAQADARYLRQRKLSPAEVFRTGAEQLTKIPAFVVAEMLGPDLAEERSARDGYIEFADAELAPEPLMFESRITTPDGRQEELKADKYQTFCNPFNLGQLFIHDAKGRHLGIARRAERVARNDPQALREALARRATRHSDLMAPILRRHAADTREETARLANNNRVLAGEPVTAEEKARAREIARDQRALGAEGAAAILAEGEDGGLRVADGEEAESEAGRVNLLDLLS